VRFEYPDDLFDGDFPEFAGREQDPFTWSSRVGKRPLCSQVLTVAGWEPAGTVSAHHAGWEMHARCFWTLRTRLSEINLASNTLDLRRHAPYNGSQEHEADD